LDQCDRNRRKECNSNAITDAQGWAAILSAFGGDSKIDPIALLPYPDDASDGGDRHLSRKTAKMLLQLEKEKKLPSRLLGQVGLFLKEAERIGR
jgi:hypothetical protein